MEHVPQPHHREGIQNELDKAYDEGHADNQLLDKEHELQEELNIAIDASNRVIAEIKGADIARKEYGDIGDKEARSSLSLEETVVLLKENGYLDTSFEGKETHSLAMRALSKEEAFAEYKTSGGKTWVLDELEKNMPYSTPKAESLDVMIMNFGGNIGTDEAVAEMDKLGVRPLTYEELIQYGIAHPSHQEQKILVGLGSKHIMYGDLNAPLLSVDVDGVRRLRVSFCGHGWGSGSRFPVVCK